MIQSFSQPLMIILLKNERHQIQIKPTPEFSSATSSNSSLVFRSSLPCFFNSSSLWNLFVCRVKLNFQLKVLSQIGHLSDSLDATLVVGLFESWLSLLLPANLWAILMCRLKFAAIVKVFSHKSHWFNFILFASTAWSGYGKTAQVGIWCHVKN